MEKRPFLTVIGVIIALVLFAGTCSAGFIAGMTLSGEGVASVADLPVLKEITEGGAPRAGEEQSATPEDLDELFEPFWQAWNLVDDMYVDQPVDKTVMMRGAIKGMLESLGDEHSSYLDPEMFESTQSRLEGEEYEGIGAWVDVTQEFLTIISPMPGSPAEEAGLRPGDQIIAIDGEDMTGKDGEYARQHVLGPSGSTVMLTVRREGVDEPFEVEVARAAITVPTVAGRMLEDENIAYVRIYTFGSDTADSLRNTLRELMEQNPDGLIVDLRYNGGGYLQTAIDVVSQFIDGGTVMYEEYGDGRRDEFQARPGGEATDIPMVVLVNEGSASASEIVAGAVQDRNRGYLVGVTTYGKGSVQNYAELTNKQGAVRVTVARWLTPGGRQIHELGLQPDFTVEFAEEDYAAGADPQLDKAVEVLTQGLTPPPTAIPTPTPTATPVP
jgi:carboxyl-terminal processing protease